ncbi:hypothetical protein [Lysinibacillus sp. LZ02]|uniref:UPF0738 family protein n=1 Tax=Lysinibacillus sp. LZ02 TaxID=3420668 RepID=UPI003D36FC52
MRNVYKVENYVDVHNKLTFSVNEEASTIQIIPAGQVIVDSDHHAFIYIVEEDGAFSYLSFGLDMWPALLEVVQRGENPYLSVGENTIELLHFYEELEALIYNIEGNDNYGESFVTAVEAAFQAILTNNEV